eukprot:4770795-Heterocapsa_arctica.AAC.1
MKGSLGGWFLAPAAARFCCSVGLRVPCGRGELSFSGGLASLMRLLIHTCLCAVAILAQFEPPPPAQPGHARLTCSAATRGGGGSSDAQAHGVAPR